jgi:hypothetical protein
MVDRVELYEDDRGNIALVHGDRAYTTSRFDLGQSFTEDAQNILDGHFQNMLTESRHSLNLTKDLRVACYHSGTMAVFVDPPSNLKNYLGVHVDE